MANERLSAFIFRLVRDEVSPSKIVEHLECVELYYPNPATRRLVRGDDLWEVFAKFADEVADRLVPITDEEECAPVEIAEPLAPHAYPGTELGVRLLQDCASIRERTRS